MKQEKRFYKVKEWNKLKPEIQEHVLKKYDVILTDWRTLRESYKYHFDKMPQHIEKGTGYITKAFDIYDNAMKEFNKGFSSLDKIGKTKDLEKMFKPKEKDYSKLLGIKHKKNYSILTGKK